jgi:hypothetical protein
MRLLFAYWRGLWAKLVGSGGEDCGELRVGICSIG